MSDRFEQIKDRLWDLVQAEVRGEQAARAISPESFVEANGTPTPPGADLMTALGMTYALLSLDYFQGNVQECLQGFGVAIESALLDPQVRARTKFQRMPPASGGRPQ